MQLPDKQTILVRLFFGAKARRKVYAKLAAMLSHDVDVKSALESLRQRGGKKKKEDQLSILLSLVLKRVGSGKPLHEAFEGLAPPEEIMLIKGGVQGGDLGKAFKLCAEIIESRQKISSAVGQAVSYPTMLSAMFVVLLLVVSRELVPSLSQISDPEGWRGSAQVLYQVAGVIDSPFGVILLLLALGLIGLALITLPSWTGAIRLKFDRVPPWSWYRLVLGSMWLMTLAAMLTAGIPLFHAIRNMQALDSTSPWLRERLQAIEAELAKGKGLGLALIDINLNFPDAELIDDIRVYFQLAGFERQLESIASEWLEEGIKKVEAQAKAVNAICLISVFGLLTGVGMAVFEMQKSIGHQALY